MLNECSKDLAQQPLLLPHMVHSILDNVLPDPRTMLVDDSQSKLWLQIIAFHNFSFVRY